MMGPHVTTPIRRGVPVGLNADDRSLSTAEEADLASLGILPARYADWQMSYAEAAQWVELLTDYNTPTMQDARAEALDDCNAMTVAFASGRDPAGHYTETKLLHTPTRRWRLYIYQVRDGEPYTRMVTVSQAEGRAKVAEAQAGLR
jgi:hypothetical protein